MEVSLRSNRLAMAIWAGFFFFACSHSSVSHKVKYEKKNWRINPTSTVLDSKRQFYLSGIGLDSAVIQVGPSVILEKGEISGDGKRLQLFLTIRPLNEEPGTNKPTDEPGKREIRINLGKIQESLWVAIVDENPKSADPD